MNIQTNLTSKRGRPRIKPKTMKTPFGRRLYDERVTKRGWSLDRAEAESKKLGHHIKRGTIYANEEGISDEPSKKHLAAFAILYGGDEPAVLQNELAQLVYGTPRKRKPEAATA